MIRRQNLARIVGRYRTQQEFADLTGTSVQYLNQLLNGTRNIGEKSARKLEKAASLAPGSLDQYAEYSAEVREPSNVSPGPLIRGMVPLISWVSAGRWREPDVTLDAPLEWLPVTFKTPNVFGLRVEGDSMEPDFPPGTIIFVDPDRKPEPMNLVVAQNGDDEATFKRLTREAGIWYLIPINPRYPIQPLTSLCKIIGVVIMASRWTA